MSYHTLTKGTSAKTVVLLGTGRLGSHLAKALRRVEGYRLVYHYGRSLGMRLEDIPRQADIYIFAISDAALPEVWASMPETRGVWIHTAGSVSLERLEAYHQPAGVLYPMQTFTKGRAIDWAEVPIYYEGDEEVRLLAEALSPQASYADSAGRAKLHLAAVLACNYSNYLVSLAEDYLAAEGFEPKALLPLLRETMEKLEKLPAHEAQTGPALRGDEATLERHRELLAGRPDLRQLYDLLAAGIQRQHNEEK